MKKKIRENHIFLPSVDLFAEFFPSISNMGLALPDFWAALFVYIKDNSFLSSSLFSGLAEW